MPGVDEAPTALKTPHNDNDTLETNLVTASASGTTHDEAAHEAALAAAAIMLEMQSAPAYSRTVGELPADGDGLSSDKKVAGRGMS